MAVGKISIPAARKMAGLTQKGLGERCNVSESTVANWENFRTEPTISQAQAIADAVGYHIDDLIFLPEDTV